jgi:hypothetical protein
MENLKELNKEELVMIEGGSFWKDMAYAIGYAAHQFKYFAEQVEENEKHLFYK